MIYFYVTFVFILLKTAVFSLNNTATKFYFVTKSNGYFSVQIYNAIKDTNNNTLISPLGLNYALTGLTEATSYKTNEELRNALNEHDELSAIIESYSALAQLINNRKTVSIFTEWFIDKEINVKKQFRKMIVEHLLTGVKTIDFSQDRNKSEEIISETMKNLSNNKISKVSYEVPTVQDAVAIVVNLVLFESRWKIPFPTSLTKNSTFYGIDGESTVDMMFIRGRKFKYARDKMLKAQLLELPLMNGYSFLIILPNHIKGMKHVEQSIFKKSAYNSRSSPFTDIFSQTQYTNVHVYLPKFNIDPKIELIPKLKKMGVRSIFKEEANFNKSVDRSMYVDDITQTTFLKVDEFGINISENDDLLSNGTSNPKSLAVQFKANHPFIFIIRDKFTKTPLFIGKYVSGSYKI